MEKPDLSPIKTATDHARAMEQIDALMLEDELSEEGVRRLKALATLVEAYEDEHFPVKPPTALEAIEFRLDQLGITLSLLASARDLFRRRT
jgi:HTH-type transcriptional regulator/antitoxin HigA